MTTVIPEIRVYSPSDLGDDSSDIDNKLVIMNRQLHRPRFGGGARLGSPASRSGDAASSENSQQSDYSFNRMLLTANTNGSKKQYTDPTLVKWENTFHTRPFTLSNFPNTAFKSTHRSQTMAINRARGGCITSSAKSLDILRQTLQRSINREIDGIVQRYLTNYFRPGIQNIIANNGENSVSEHHVHAVCRQMLEDAKKMYHMGMPVNRSSSPVDGSDAENLIDVRQRRYVHKGPVRKRKESDTDSEASLNPKPKKRKGRPPLNLQGSPSGRSTPSKISVIRREGSKWNPDRLTSDTQFIMGAKANKALGLGATRGRLYIKHPDVFKYSGDQDDKQWLYDHSLMPATGGKAYMLLVEDILELAELEEYKNSSGLCTEEIVGFTVSETILGKMRQTMMSMRTDLTVIQAKKGKLTAMDSLSDQGSGFADMGSRTGSPTNDELDMGSTHASPFSLEKCFGQVASPNGGEQETPLSAPFDVTTH